MNIHHHAFMATPLSSHRPHFISQRQLIFPIMLTYFSADHVGEAKSSSITASMVMAAFLMQASTQWQFGVEVDSTARTPFAWIIGPSSRRPGVSA